MVLPASTRYLIDDVLGEESSLLYPLLGPLVAATTVRAITSFTLTRILSVEGQHLIAGLRAGSSATSYACRCAPSRTRSRASSCRGS